MHVIVDTSAPQTNRGGMVLPRRLIALWSSAAAAVAAVGSERGPPPATGPSTASGVVHMVFDVRARRLTRGPAWRCLAPAR